MDFICFASVDPLVLASESRYFFGRAVQEGASDEEVGALPEQVFAWAAGTAGAKDAERCPSWSSKILISVV